MAFLTSLFLGTARIQETGLVSPVLIALDLAALGKGEFPDKMHGKYEQFVHLRETRTVCSELRDLFLVIRLRPHSLHKTCCSMATIHGCGFGPQELCLAPSSDRMSCLLGGTNGARHVLTFLPND